MANHTEDKKLGKRLDVIFAKVQKLLDTYTDEEPPKTVKIEEPRKAKMPKTESATATVFQFKITLKGIEPPIWRRIQVKDCTLDELHEHIQTAMGWTNSQLHQFKIGGVPYGDPELLCEGFEDDPEIVNSLDTRLGKVVPKNGNPCAAHEDSYLRFSVARCRCCSHPMSARKSP